MLKRLDRYLIREILPPSLLGLLVLTFMLEIPPILQPGGTLEKLIERGVEWRTIIRILLTLLPQALGLTISAALLLGILIGLGRLSSDRELVALQACGVSPFRLLRPTAALAALSTAATAYVMFVALPGANQVSSEIAFAEGDVKPRVFFQAFPKRVIYFRDLTPDGGWSDVFLADATYQDEESVYLAQRGRLVIDHKEKTVALLLEDGIRHTTRAGRPEEYQGMSFARLLLRLDAEAVFQRVALLKGPTEMTVAELRQSIATAATRGDPAYNQIMAIQQKFSFPVACLALALIGLGLGVTHRQGGTFASLVLGFGVIFLYYMLLFSSKSLTKAGLLSPILAPWIPNIVVGAIGVLLVLWRAKRADRAIRFGLLNLSRRPGAGIGVRKRFTATSPKGGRGALGVRFMCGQLPRPRLLDLYVGRLYVQVFSISVVSLLVVFYVSTLIDLADKLFGGAATARTLLRYFYFQTPQFAYYVIPMATLIAALVTVGLLTRSSELIVMRACGVSLYRAAGPILVVAAVTSGVLFGLEERVLVYSNRRADDLNRAIRGLPTQTLGVPDRQWVVGVRGDLYHYESFDPRVNTLAQLSAYHVDDRSWRLVSLTHAKDAEFAQQARNPNGGSDFVWQAHQGWARNFGEPHPWSTVTTMVSYTPFVESTLSLESPAYFTAEQPGAETMTYRQLQRYIEQLQARGYNAVPSMVQLQRKVAFPFVTLVMTLLAVPFAVTTGQRGALHGVGVGIVLALVYWILLSIFGAIGAGGSISPSLAAWAPNVLFVAVATFLLLSVRT